jgi:hypothetical protein
MILGTVVPAPTDMRLNPDNKGYRVLWKEGEGKEGIKWQDIERMEVFMQSDKKKSDTR